MAERTGTVGSMGPRLAGRLTADLILRSPQYMNCVSQYEINLRGSKISAIENLGATENQFDCFDLSDNAIVKLEGFPKLPRLKQLLLNNNRISKIVKQLEAAIPNLESLVMTNNRLANLQDVDPLASLSKLVMLSLMGNPVTTKQHYRLYVISKLKSLKILDFKKVKQQERKEAEKLFPDAEAAAQQAAKTFDPNADLEAVQEEALRNSEAAAASAAAAAAEAKARTAAGPTPEQLIAVKAAIAAATTLEEVSRLEQALTSGHLPSTMQIDEGPTAVHDASAAAPAAESEAGQPEGMEVG